eukprot:PhF_6_TR27837/c0_g2_i1/m.40620
MRFTIFIFDHGRNGHCIREDCDTLCKLLKTSGGSCILYIPLRCEDLLSWIDTWDGDGYLVICGFGSSVGFTGRFEDTVRFTEIANRLKPLIPKNPFVIIDLVATTLSLDLRPTLKLFEGCTLMSSLTWDRMSHGRSLCHEILSYFFSPTVHLKEVTPYQFCGDLRRMTIGKSYIEGPHLFPVTEGTKPFSLLECPLSITALVYVSRQAPPASGVDVSLSDAVHRTLSDILTTFGISLTNSKITYRLKIQVSPGMSLEQMDQNQTADCFFREEGYLVYEFSALPTVLRFADANRSLSGNRILEGFCEVVTTPKQFLTTMSECREKYGIQEIVGGYVLDNDHAGSPFGSPRNSMKCKLYNTGAVIKLQRKWRLYHLKMKLSKVSQFVRSQGFAFANVQVEIAGILKSNPEPLRFHLESLEKAILVPFLIFRTIQGILLGMAPGWIGTSILLDGTFAPFPGTLLAGLYLLVQCLVD